MKPAFKCKMRAKRLFKGCGALFITVLVGALFLNIGYALTEGGGNRYYRHHRR